MTPFQAFKAKDSYFVIAMGNDTCGTNSAAALIERPDS